MPGRILVLDDEEKYAQMLSDLLADNGYQAEISTSPPDALAKIRQENFELVVTDYKMPIMDGSEFLVAARKTNPDLPVIIISGLMNLPELLKVANIGVTLVLEKPFDAEDFLHQVERFVKHNDQEDDRIDVSSLHSEGGSRKGQGDGEVPALYPQPTTFLSDASLENRQLLNHLWLGLKEARHLILPAMTGHEFRLLTQEILQWQGADPEEVLPCVDIGECEGDMFNSWISELEEFPSILIMEIRQGALTEETYNQLTDWINFLESARSDLSGKLVIYAMGPRCRFDSSKLSVSKKLQTIIRGDIPAMLPLRDRVQDQAVYTRRRLGELGDFVIEPEAAELILNYDWQGGYAELLSTINRVAISLQGHRVLTYQDLRKALMERSKDKGIPDAVGLEPYLRRRQREFIQTHQEKGEDWKTTLMRLGYQNEGQLNPNLSLEEQPILYPSVLDLSLSEE